MAVPRALPLALLLFAPLLFARLLFAPGLADAQTPPPTTSPASPSTTTRHEEVRHPEPHHPEPHHVEPRHPQPHHVVRPPAHGRPPVIVREAHPPRQRPAHTAVPVVPAPAPAAPPSAEAATPPDKGSVTGLPLPRFAALRSDDVNLRAGPGTRYPIDWVYKRRDLPVEIEREFDVWRLISDMDGVRGWVNQATLVARRGFVVSGAERTIRSAANDQAGAVARLQVGVIGRIRACAATSDWCEVQVGDYRGWLQRSDFWGTLPGEAVQP